MKKFFTVLGIFAVASAASASTAVAPAGFDILGGPVIEIEQGESVWIGISVTSAGDMEGLNMRVGVDVDWEKDPMDFEILDIDFRTDCVWIPSDIESGWNTYGDAAVKIITTASAGEFRHIEPGELLARVLVKAGGEEGFTADFTTNYTNNWDPAGFAGSSAPVEHSTVTLKIVPEPTAALLLLAGFPMLRRRRA